MQAPTSSLTPVILSGGSGTRLWPMSTPARPKQFLPLASENSMLQATLARTSGLSGCGRPIIVASGAHADLVAEQAGDAVVILEPCARNTAPAIALAALAAEKDDCTLLVMPSDHVIADLPAFHEAIARAQLMAESGWLVTLGIRPDKPETGYGYIALGDQIVDGVHRVARFVEKPDRSRAEQMVASGDHLWNAGIFLFRARVYLGALERFEPKMLAAARAALAGQSLDAARLVPDCDAFEQSPSNSIDYAVMERADRVACVPVDMGWSDLGSWDALHDISKRDEAENSASNSVTLIDSRNCLVRSDGVHVTLVGVEDLIVVASGDQVMIVPRGKSQLVKQAAEAASKRR